MKGEREGVTFCSMASSRMWACTCGGAQGRGSGLADSNDSKGSQSLVPVFGCCGDCCLWDLLPSPSESSTFSLFSFAIIRFFYLPFLGSCRLPVRSVPSSKMELAPNTHLSCPNMTADEVGHKTNVTRDDRIESETFDI